MASKSEATSPPATIWSLFAEAEGLSKLEKQLTCPKCSVHFTNPKLLPCFHSFCLRCLEQLEPVELVKGSHYPSFWLPCPTCQTRCPVPDEGLATLPSSFVINNLIEVHDLMKKVSGSQHTYCDNCDENNRSIADCYCKQCAQLFCQDCLSFHNKLKRNATHETPTLEEVASTAHELRRTRPEDAISCAEHKEPLTVFCETCPKLICHLCAVKKHKDHEYDAVTNLYKKYRDAIDESSFQPLNQEFDQLTSTKTILDRRIKEIDEQAKTTCESIDRTITEIREHLDEIGEQMKNTVSSARDVKVGILNHQLDELKTKLGQVSECQDQLKLSVEVATPHQLLISKEQVINHSSDVIDSTGDKKRFQPLEQADIELVKAANIHSKIGDIKFSLTSTKASLVSSDCIPLTSKPSTITVSLSLPDGTPARVPSSLIKCHLTPPENMHDSWVTNCSVKESTSGSGQYDILCTPVTTGSHQLHIETAQGQELRGSPVGLLVPLCSIFSSDASATTTVTGPITSPATSSSELSNVLKLLKLTDISSGLKCFPDEGRIEVTSTDENEREKIISLFQEAYQRIVQNPEFQSGTIELPTSVRAEDVAVVLDQYNAKYHQCVFTYNTTSHSIDIITMSSQHFDQAKKLLEERLTSEADTTPTSIENSFDANLPSSPPPGLIPDNNLSTSEENLTGSTGGHGLSTPELSYSSSGSSEQPFLLDSLPFSTSVLLKNGSLTKTDSAKFTDKSHEDREAEFLKSLEISENPKAFCSGCLSKYLTHHSCCPTCKTPLKQVKGYQPIGTMNSHENQYQHLPGFENCGMITIIYYFPNGIQGPSYANPGQPYSGKTYMAYLPRNKEGRQVLKLFRRAFDDGLMFTIGTSATSGKDTVVWNGIHHKTNTYGGSTVDGYPDDTYLKQVQEELKAKGIY